MDHSNSNPEIRDLQLVQLEILLEFDRICKKHNIRYQLFSGTLIGCIRHQGFIPWDDDIDVCLIREEYDRFLEIAKIELDEKFFLQTYETDRNTVKRLARIRKNNTLYLQEQYQFIKMHHGIPISLMPLDNVKPGTFIGEFHRAFYQFLLVPLRKLNYCRSWDNCINKNKNKPLRKSVTILLHVISKFIPKKFTDNFHNKIACMFNGKETEYIAHLTNGATKKRYKAFMMSRKDFFDVISGKFEGHTFPIPRNYDKLLTNIYGDYMTYPPIEEQKPKHYVTNVILDTKSAQYCSHELTFKVHQHRS